MISRLRRLRKNFIEFGGYVAAEFTDFLSYMNALFIGAMVNFFSGLGLPGLVIPYLIPLLVQIISKSMVKYRNRHLRRLIQLPAEREDPAFIMGEEGEILLATGVTRLVFDHNKVVNIRHFIGESGFRRIRESLDESRSSYRMENVYSPCSEKWYEVRIKPVEVGAGIREYLVWFVDVSDKKIMNRRLSVF